MKAIQYREDGKFYGFYKPDQQKKFYDTMNFFNEYHENIAAGKEIINPEVLFEYVPLLDSVTIKPGEVFDCPDNIEFEEKEIPANDSGIDGSSPPYSKVDFEKVIHLKLKEVKPSESQDELWNEVAISFMNKYSNPAIEENKSKFTIQRNKNI